MAQIGGLGGLGVDPSLYGGSATGEFVKQLTARAQEIMKMQTQVGLQVGGEVAGKLALAPYEVEQAGAIQAAKTKAEVANDPFKSMLAKAATQSEGAEAMPGSDPFGSLRSFQQQLPAGVSVGPSGVTVSRPEIPVGITNASLQLEALKGDFAEFDATARKIASSTTTPAAEGLIPGTIATSRAFLTGGKSDSNLKQYVDSLPAMAVGLYRNTSGDTRIANEDARERAMPQMWRPDQGEVWEPTGREKMEKWARRIKRREEYLKSGKYYSDLHGQTLTPFSLLDAEDGAATGSETVDEFGGEFLDE